MIEAADYIVTEYANQGLRITLRQLFYQFVQRGWILNKQKEYKRLCKAVANGRDAGMIDWDAIVDRLREAEIPYHRRDGAHAIQTSGRVFQLDLWRKQECRVEVWVEKDALSEVVAHACRDLRVPYVVCRGYASQTAIYESATRMLEYVAGTHNEDEIAQWPVILHLGDHDPSGMHMSVDNHQRLLKYMARGKLTVEQIAPCIEFRRIALNMDQIEELNPPPNDAKLTDPRAEDYIAEFGEVSWELDALSPAYLHNLIQTEIKAWIDDAAFEAARVQEAKIKKDLARMSSNYHDIMDFLGGSATKKKRKKPLPVRRRKSKG